jgi:AcrR family transcriptional regulator
VLWTIEALAEARPYPEVGQENELTTARAVSEQAPRGARTAKQERSKKREAEILAAAVTVFARDGIAVARVSDIAAEAKVPISSIYDYFKSKEDLAYLVPVATFGKFFEEYERQSRRLHSAQERLRRILLLSAEFAEKNPDWARVLYLEVWPSVMVKDSRVRFVIDRYARMIVDLIQEGGTTGEWPKHKDCYQLAAIIIGAISQTVITWLLYERPKRLSKGIVPVVNRLMQLLLLPAKG